MHAIKSESFLAVDGIHNVISVLDEVERGGLKDIKYIEAQACTGGCIGGPLVPQNPFVSRVRMENLNRKLKGSSPQVKEKPAPEIWYIDTSIKPRPAMELSSNITEAMEMLTEVERILENLPGLDCGSCGSPSCRSLAEDIVRGHAKETYCIFKLRERLQQLAREMVDLSHKTPPAMGRGREEDF